MADSLDDFFAKKDKKRGKDKAKAAFSAEALVKELEEGSRQAEYPVRKDVKTSTAIELLGLDADDADWRDFEDIEKRDYSGLKVKEMSLQDQNEEEQRRLTAEQSEPVSEATPWKLKDETSSAESNAKQDPDSKGSESTSSDSKTASSSTDANKSTDTPAAMVENKTDSTTKEDDTKSAKAYVPPHLRNAEGGVKVLKPVRMSSMRPRISSNDAPDIKDTKSFPGLG